jgi:hypothetical protein
MTQPKIKQTKRLKNTQTTFFSSTRKFLPLGDRTPKNIILFVQETFTNLFTDIKTGKLKVVTPKNSQQCLPGGRERKRSAVVIYDNGDLTEAADNCEFVELILFYGDPDRHSKCIANLEKTKDSWYTISASNATGECVINNFIICGTELIQLIKETYRDATRPFQELLAYRTDSLRDAIVLACSKPF